MPLLTAVEPQIQDEAEKLRYLADRIILGPTFKRIIICSECQRVALKIASYRGGIRLLAARDFYLDLAKKAVSRYGIDIPFKHPENSAESVF